MSESGFIRSSGFIKCPSAVLLLSTLLCLMHRPAPEVRMPHRALQADVRSHGIPSLPPDYPPRGDAPPDRMQLPRHLAFCLCILPVVSVCRAQESPPAQGAPFRQRDAEKVHDPSTLITVDGVRRFFNTGAGVSLMRERDGKWLREGRVFEEGKFPATAATCGRRM